MEEQIGYLIFTILVETFIVFLLTRVSVKRMVFATLCINLITHPIAWYLISEDVGWLLTECGVLFFEMLVFSFLFPGIRRKAMVAIGCANIISAVMGLFIPS